jgi:hypothetical protein
MTECVQQSEGTVEEGKREKVDGMWSWDHRKGGLFFPLLPWKYLEFYVPQQQHGKHLQPQVYNDCCHLPLLTQARLDHLLVLEDVG